GADGGGAVEAHRPPGAAPARPPPRAAGTGVPAPHPPHRAAPPPPPRGTHQTWRCGAGRDGTLQAIEAEALVEFGMAGWRAVTTPATTLYRCANVRGLEANLKLELRRGNAFRAPAVMEGVTALEQAMDELAVA